MLDEHNCLIVASPKLRFSAHAKIYKPLIRCAESLMRDDIVTFCLQMADEQNYLILTS